MKFHIFAAVALLMLLSACSQPKPSSVEPQDDTPLVSTSLVSHSESDVSASRGNYRIFEVDVPAGSSNLIIRSSGGTGDADLYVRAGAQPTTTSYDCRSWASGNNESCTIASPSAGRYYIMLRAYRSFANLSLSYSYNAPAASNPSNPSPPNAPASSDSQLRNGVEVTNISAAEGAWLLYHLDIPAAASNLRVTTSGGSGDIDLYVAKGSHPSNSSYDCRSWATGNNESCTIASLSEGRYYVALKAYKASSNVTLLARYDGGADNGGNDGGNNGGNDSNNVLSNGVALSVPEVTAGSSQLYSIVLPAGAKNLRITTSGGSGDVDLYVRHGSAPDKSGSYDCRSWATGNTEECGVGNPNTGSYYILLDAYKTFSGVQLTASYESATGGNGNGLGDNLSNDPYERHYRVSNLSATRGNGKRYSLSLPAKVARLEIRSSGGTGGGANLYIGIDRVADSYFHDCQSTAYGNNESCEFSFPKEATYNILLDATRQNYAGVTLDIRYYLERDDIPAGHTLSNGQAKRYLSGAAQSQQVYALEIPDGARDLQVQLSSGSGSVKMYVRRAYHARFSGSSQRFDCDSNCTIKSPQPGYYFITLLGTSSYRNASLTAGYHIGDDDDFDINFLFHEEVPEHIRTYFVNAGNAWENVITGDIPASQLNKNDNRCEKGDPAFSGTIDDVVIYIRYHSDDGVGNRLAHAGPCLLRNGNGLPTYGVMTFDSDDFSAARFPTLIMHEMAHVFGFGILWQRQNLVNYTTSCPSAPHYHGSNALREWHSLGGEGNIPVEQDGGAHTACAHWDEQVFDKEIMTGYNENNGSQPLSRMTIASFEDLGYAVNYGAADRYSLPTCRPNCSDSNAVAHDRAHELNLDSHGTIHERAEVFLPLGIVLEDGSIVAVQPH